MPITIQEKILAAASELFYSQGIRATGVDAIAKAANTHKNESLQVFSFQR
jgi:AcrR family transcriptional regulator